MKCSSQIKKWKHCSCVGLAQKESVDTYCQKSNKIIFLLGKSGNWDRSEKVFIFMISSQSKLISIIKVRYFSD